jgi:CBS-domain-containing membrane protein
MKKLLIKPSKIRVSHAFIASIKTGIFMICLLRLFEFEIAHLSALASSSFAAFCFPENKNEETKRLIGSYFIAIIIGIICSYIFTLPWVAALNWHGLILAGISIGLTILTLTLLSLEHPPSAAIALGFVTNPWNWQTPLILMVSIIALVLFRSVTRKWDPFFNKKRPHKKKINRQ